MIQDRAPGLYFWSANLTAVQWTPRSTQEGPINFIITAIGRLLNQMSQQILTTQYPGDYPLAWKKRSGVAFILYSSYVRMSDPRQ